MNLATMRGEIRTELSDAGSFWTDPELTRAVVKSVSLMSRLIPKRAVVEATIIIDVDAESFTTPTTASATAIVNAADISATVSGGTLTVTDSTPDVPRRLTVTVTDANASITNLVVIVKGYDQDGKYIEENWHLANMVSGTAYQGNLYFNKISQVEVDAIAGNGAGDTLSVGTGNAYDSHRFLANKAIKYDSEVVTSSPAGTTYVRDTAYRIDYINGTIKFINGGGMAAGTAYLISYDLDPTILSLEGVLPKESYSKIEKVEYPVGDSPPTYVLFETFGDMLILKDKSISLTEDNHIRIIYLEPWAAPGTNSDGDYPEHLDDVIIIGSCGQALLIKAEKYVQQSLTELALVNSTADLMTAVLTNADTALAKVATHVTEAGTALTKVALYLETNDTTDNAQEILADITDNAADLRTAIETALDLISTYVNNASAPGARFYLETGDAYITSVNDGEKVAETYADYARASIQIFQGLVAEATTRLANIKSYIEEANGWIRMGDSFTAEAAQRLGMANSFVNEAAQRVREVEALATQADRYAATTKEYLNIAGRYLASGQAKVNEFLVALGIKPEFATSKSSSGQFA